MDESTTNKQKKGLKHWIEENKITLEFIAIIIGFFGFFISTCESASSERRLYKIKMQEAEAKKIEAFQLLGNSYVGLLDDCIKYPCLDCYDLPLKNPPKLSPSETHHQRLLYTKIINHFEQGYTTLHFYEEYWKGWEIYIDRYLARESFRNVWHDIDSTWGKEIQGYLSKKVDSLLNTPNAIKNIIDNGIEYKDTCY